MKIWLILILFQPGDLNRIFTFKPSFEKSISYATLKYPIPLTDSFTLCSSFKQNSINGTGFFNITGEDDKTWMFLGTWKTEINFNIWIKVSSVWTVIEDFSPFWMNFWIHVCIHADTKSGDMSISLNGEPILSFNMPLGVKKPANLQGKLFLGGLTEYDNERIQFQGQVANINIFSDKSAALIRNMSGSLCDQDGDLVNSGTEWVMGGAVSVSDGETWNICNKNLTYRVAIPAKMSWYTSVQVCHTLGGGNLTEANSRENIKQQVSLYGNINSTCDKVWTPYTDEEVEGQFKSSVTGQLVNYLPWNVDQPDGAETEKFISLNIQSEGFDDSISNRLLCASCDVDKTTEFSLIGVCEDTYFGKVIHK